MLDFPGVTGIFVPGLGKGEVESSILSCSTTNSQGFRYFSLVALCHFLRNVAGTYGTKRTNLTQGKRR